MRRLISFHPPRAAFPVLAACALAVAGCGDRSAPAPAPRPVLVVTPAVAPGNGASAFAGEIRAREESALAFQVGGQLLRRHVDAGGDDGRLWNDERFAVLCLQAAVTVDSGRRHNAVERPEVVVYRPQHARVD